jgi:hypothetical protein
MNYIRYAILFGSLIILVFALGFIYQREFATSIWPWPDGRLSYLFIGSILAAVSAAALWIGWTGELGALPAGSLNVFVIALGCVFYLFPLATERPGLLGFAWVSLVYVLISGLAFLWSSRIPLSGSPPTPMLVRVSFALFAASLLFAGTALIFKQPIFPWNLNPDSSVIFGCIFIGDAFYFLHALFKPLWRNAAGQLLSFLAYDLVLIPPFLRLFETVEPAFRFSLSVYVLVLIYSGAIAIYYLFLNPRTRTWLSPVWQKD